MFRYKVKDYICKLIIANSVFNEEKISVLEENVNPIFKKKKKKGQQILAFIAESPIFAELRLMASVL